MRGEASTIRFAVVTTLQTVCNSDLTFTSGRAKGAARMAEYLQLRCHTVVLLGRVIMYLNQARSSFLLLVFALAGTAQAADFAGGTGEPNDPYLIATREQFLAADFSQAGVHYQLCCDIDLDRGFYWDRLRTTQSVVRAHLDGAGFEIQSALLIDMGGFFATIESEGTVANLTLADLDFGLTN